jgi:hypothetical protein
MIRNDAVEGGAVKEQEAEAGSQVHRRKDMGREDMSRIIVKTHARICSRKQKIVTSSLLVVQTISDG